MPNNRTPSAPQDNPATQRPVSTPGRTDLNDPHRSGAAETGRSDSMRKRSGTDDPTASDVSDGQRLPGSQDGAGTEPRAGTRLGGPSSQGLTGAQGSGGGADRGLADAPARKRSSSAGKAAGPQGGGGDEDGGGSSGNGNGNGG